MRNVVTVEIERDAPCRCWEVRLTGVGHTAVVGVVSEAKYRRWGHKGELEEGSAPVQELLAWVERWI